MKKTVVALILFCVANMAFAIDFDTSIDSAIRKDYKLKESEETLPALPNVSPSENSQPVTKMTQVKTDYQRTGKLYTIKKGTKIILASQKSVNDRYARGSKIGFVTQNNVLFKDGTTMPAGTLLKATVTDSHGPQITGNGGLVELYFNEIYFNGVKSPFDSKLKKANYKNVHFNDIKGERRYWKNWRKAMKPGEKTFKATKKASHAIRIIPIVCHIPILLGSVVYTINFVTAPIIMVFLKGGSLSLPAGTRFEIQTGDDIEIRG